MRIIVLVQVVYLLFLSSFSYPQGRKGIPPEKPKLIIAVVVDQMRYDYIYRYWDKYSKGGIKRLVQEGTLCKNTNLNYLFTQTAVGHSSIFTGATPSVHGIVSNEWYNQLKNIKLYCVSDPKTVIVDSKSKEPGCSPFNLMASTIGDEIRLSTNQKAKVIGIAMKDRAAVLSSGHQANAAYWYDNTTGKWITSSYYMDTLPKWVKEFNRKDFSDFYLEKIWDTMLPMDEYTESLPDDNPYETGLNRTQHVFPYNLAELSEQTRGKKNYNLLNYVPFGNTYTLDFTLAAIINENLGKDTDTDLLIASFSAIDFIGHYFGPRSVEMEDAMLRMDKIIEHLLTFIDDNLGKENVLVFLTADHGVADPPRYMTDRHSPAGIFKQNLCIALLKSYLNALYGEGEWVKDYIEQQIYLNHELIDDAKIPLEEIQEKCAEFMVQVTGVAQAVSATTLQRNYFSDGIYHLIQNTYYRQRCGDIIISLAPGYIEDIACTTTHNSAYSYDTHIPLIWYGWKIKRSIIEEPISVTDIAPTISTLMNISFPNGCFGKPIPGLTQ